MLSLKGLDNCDFDDMTGLLFMKVNKEINSVIRLMCYGLLCIL